MNEKDLKKIVALQERMDKIRSQVEEMCLKHNTILYDELDPLATELLSNTLYVVDGIPYRLGDLSHGIDWQIHTSSIGVKCLHPMRRPEKKKDAPLVYKAD
jgi:hypothetical protein